MLSLSISIHANFSPRWPSPPKWTLDRVYSSATRAALAPLLGLPSFACIRAFLQPHIRIAHPHAFAGFQRFVASKNQFVPTKRSHGQGDETECRKRGNQSGDPLRVRGDLSEGGVAFNLDQRLILGNKAAEAVSFHFLTHLQCPKLLIGIFRKCWSHCGGGSQALIMAVFEVGERTS